MNDQGLGAPQGHGVSFGWGTVRGMGGLGR